MIAVLEVAQAETVVKFMPRSPYFIEMMPEAISTIIFGMKKGLKRGVPSPCANSVTCCWNVPIPPFPDPQITPIRSLFSVSKLMLAFLTASSTEIKAYCVNKSYFLASAFSIWFKGSKPLSSQANFVLNFDVSNLVMGLVPLTPVKSDCQKSSTLFPMGVNAPSPVITTLSIILSLCQLIFAGLLRQNIFPSLSSIFLK